VGESTNRPEGLIAYDPGQFAPIGFYPARLDRRMVFSAGLSVGATLDGSAAVSQVEYVSEFQPGPILNPGAARQELLAADPAALANRIYECGSRLGRCTWPFELGAPERLCRGLVLGDRDTYCVYNDLADSLSGDAEQRPLGIEVRQWTQAFRLPAPEQEAFLFRHEIINRANQALEGVYLSFWVDPDLGRPSNDLVGIPSEPEEPEPGRIQDAPVAVSLGSLPEQPVPAPLRPILLAPADNDTLRDAEQVSFSWKAVPGAVSYELATADCYDFDVAGVVTEVTEAQATIEVAEGPRHWRVRAIYAGGLHSPWSESRQLTTELLHSWSITTSYRDLDLDYRIEVETIAGERWWSGVQWGGRGLYGSLDFGADFFGSEVSRDDVPRVELRFSDVPEEQSVAATYRLDQSYAAADNGVFPGSAWALTDSTERRLNLCFVEYEIPEKPANLLWDPGSQFEQGIDFTREYLTIMESDYTTRPDTIYDDDNWGLAADVYYMWWPAIRSGHEYMEDPSGIMRISPTSPRRCASNHSERALSVPAYNLLDYLLDELSTEGFDIFEVVVDREYVEFRGWMEEELEGHPGCMVDVDVSGTGSVHELYGEIAYAISRQCRESCGPEAEAACGSLESCEIEVRAVRTGGESGGGEPGD
jgi:hypothetical protein